MPETDQATGQGLRAISVTSHLTKRLLDLLDEQRVVVWYDGEDAFKDFVAAFRAPACRVVMATDSTLRARREAESVYGKMNDSDNHAEARANLLLYVPRARGATPEARQRDPFEVFALAGAAFGDNEAELLQSIARQLPDALSVVPRAEAPQRERILAVCERMRTSDQFRDGYIDLAGRVESDLRLAAVTQDIENLGVLDTVAFEERQYLARLLRRVEEKDLAAARSILHDPRRSIWRHLPERALLWSVAERCVDFVETTATVEKGWKSEASSTKSMVQAYARPEGCAELDRRQCLYRRAFHNLTTNDNLERDFNDYRPVQIVSPYNGEAITVYDLGSASELAQVDTVVTNATGGREQVYNGFEFSLEARLPGGGTFLAGSTTQHTITKTCDEVDDPNRQRFCDRFNLPAPYQGVPFRSDLKLAGSYPLPGDLQASARLTSMPGRNIGDLVRIDDILPINWSISRSTRYTADGCAGRACTPGALVIPSMVLTSLTVPLAPTGTERFYPRLNQLDLGIKKIFRLRGVSYEATFEVFNALNADTIVAERSANFGTPAYALPSQILLGRLPRLLLLIKW